MNSIVLEDGCSYRRADGKLVTAYLNMDRDDVTPYTYIADGMCYLPNGLYLDNSPNSPVNKTFALVEKVDVTQSKDIMTSATIGSYIVSKEMVKGSISVVRGEVIELTLKGVRLKFGDGSNKFFKWCNTLELCDCKGK